MFCQNRDEIFMPNSISGHSIDAAVRNPNDMRRLLQGIAQRIAIYDDQLGIFDGFLDDPSDVPASKPAVARCRARAMARRSIWARRRTSWSTAGWTGVRSHSRRITRGKNAI